MLYIMYFIFIILILIFITTLYVSFDVSSNIIIFRIVVYLVLC